MAIRALDLNIIHFVLVTFGVWLSVWAMQLSGTKQLAGDERDCIRWARRIGYATTALGMLWGLSFGFHQGWEPWPPYLVVLAGIDLALITSVLNGYRRVAVKQTA